MNDLYPLDVTEGRVLYGVIRAAVRAANYNFSPKNERAILIWNDTIKDADYFSTLHPWQVVNRLPSINIICRKAPFVRLIQRIQTYFPSLYSFLPKSYILPIQNPEFYQIVSKHQKKYIIKPDNGSLGQGITIIDEKMSYNPVTHLSIAQEYIESCLVNETKFDCRIYVLVTSIENLQIYVYRGGVARFCSQKSGTDSIYSQITNTAVNRKNPGTTIDKITRMVPDVFEELAQQGADVDHLWKEIDKVAVSTILSVYNYLLQGVKKKCPSFGYSRCFQILGFDILIDKKYNPKLLEVNYRPSLERDTDAESKMKCEMLSEAMKIAVPLNEIQKRLSRSKINYNENGWRNFMKANPSLEGVIEKQRKINLKESHFAQAYPSGDALLDALYKEVIQKVESLPIETESKYRLPVLPSATAADGTDGEKAAREKLPPINGNNRNPTAEEKVGHVESADIAFLPRGDSCEGAQLQKSSSGVIQKTSVVVNERPNTPSKQKDVKSEACTQNVDKPPSSFSRQQPAVRIETGTEKSGSSLTKPSEKVDKPSSSLSKQQTVKIETSTEKVDKPPNSLSKQQTVKIETSTEKVDKPPSSLSKQQTVKIEASVGIISKPPSTLFRRSQPASPVGSASKSPACSANQNIADEIARSPEKAATPTRFLSTPPSRGERSTPSPRFSHSSRASPVGDLVFLQLSDSSSAANVSLNAGGVDLNSSSSGSSGFLGKIDRIVARTERVTAPPSHCAPPSSSDDDFTYMLSDPNRLEGDDSETAQTVGRTVFSTAKLAPNAMQPRNSNEGIYFILNDPREVKKSDTNRLNRAKSSSMVARAGEEVAMEKSYLPRLNQSGQYQAVKGVTAGSNGSPSGNNYNSKLNSQVVFKDSPKRTYVPKKYAPPGH